MVPQELALGVLVDFVKEEGWKLRNTEDRCSLKCLVNGSQCCCGKPSRHWGVRVRANTCVPCKPAKVPGHKNVASVLMDLMETEQVAESPVFLDASQLEDLASAMHSVSLTPSLEAACRSRSNTPERLTSRESAAITSAMPTVSDGQPSYAPFCKIWRRQQASVAAGIMLKPMCHHLEGGLEFDGSLKEPATLQGLSDGPWRLFQMTA